MKVLMRANINAIILGYMEVTVKTPRFELADLNVALVLTQKMKFLSFIEKLKNVVTV